MRAARIFWLAACGIFWKMRANGALDRMRLSDRHVAQLEHEVEREQWIRAGIEAEHDHACRRAIDCRSRLQREQYLRSISNYRKAL